MSKKLKIYLLIALTAICAACAFAGCKIGRPGRDEVLADYKAHVTYYSNGGFFNQSTTMTVRDLYFKNDPSSENYDANGVPFFEITGETTGMNVARDGYDLVGWYLPATYEDGENAGKIMYTYTYLEADGKTEITVPVFPVLDEDGNPVTDSEADRPVFARAGVDEQITENFVRVVASDVRLDSTRKVADDENLTVCAKWAPALKIVYKLVCEEGKTYADEDGNTYTNGSELRVDNFGNGVTSSPTSLAPISLKGASFVRNYLEIECENEVTPIARPEGDEPENPVVYAWYLDGEDWTIVADPSDVVSMFNGLGSVNNKYYLLKSIDCSSRTFNLKNQNVTVNATVEGNGKTLSHLKFSLTGASTNHFSIFGKLGASFKLSGLILEDVSINIVARGNISLYAVCNTVEASASVTGLKIDGLTAHVQIPSGNRVENVQSNTQSGEIVESRDHWLFEAGESDQAFMATNGIEVTGETLTIEN